MYQFMGLKKNKQFRQVYAKGKSIPDKLLVIYCMPNGLDFTRFGFCVGKKIGKAVTRNRVKRILREISRLNWSIFKEGYDCVFIARPRIAEEDYHAIEKSFFRLINKADLKKDEM